jgi:CheY-like chemotaxis protein
VTRVIEMEDDLSTSRDLNRKDVNTQEISQKDFLVLVVDDAVDNLVLLSLDLQQAGYRVITSSDGEEALRVAPVAHPDLILMDIGMPGLDGLGATRKIREDPTLQGIPIIAITAFGTEGFRRAAYDAGFDGYLTKPIDFDRMHDLIRSLLPVR